MTPFKMYGDCENDDDFVTRESQAGIYTPYAEGKGNLAGLVIGKIRSSDLASIERLTLRLQGGI